MLEPCSTLKLGFFVVVFLPDSQDSEDEEEDDDFAEEEEMETAVGETTVSLKTTPQTNGGDISSDDDAENCPICLNTFRNQAVGTPESCAHYFCLDCIVEWSKVSPFSLFLLFYPR
uniref:RING-type domain-containing protein n=1 Tax=Chelydra serpentina TaxID=8475 RepID=A0A8C3RV15_CHESE